MCFLMLCLISHRISHNLSVHMIFLLCEFSGDDWFCIEGFPTLLPLIGVLSCVNSVMNFCAELWQRFLTLIAHKASFLTAFSDEQLGLTSEEFYHIHWVSFQGELSWGQWVVISERIFHIYYFHMVSVLCLLILNEVGLLVKSYLAIITFKDFLSCKSFMRLNEMWLFVEIILIFIRFVSFLLHFNFLMFKEGWFSHLLTSEWFFLVCFLMDFKGWFVTDTVFPWKQDNQLQCNPQSKN